MSPPNGENADTRLYRELRVMAMNSKSPHKPLSSHKISRGYSNRSTGQTVVDFTVSWRDILRILSITLEMERNRLFTTTQDDAAFRTNVDDTDRAGTRNMDRSYEIGYSPVPEVAKMCMFPDIRSPTPATCY